MFSFLIRYLKPELISWRSSIATDGSNRIDEYFYLKLLNLIAR